LIPGGDNTARLWELPGGTQTRPPVVQTGWVSALALSRDGRRLFVRSGDAYGGEVRLWDASLDRPLGPARTHTG
jgi:WD40 repeat protein